MRVTPHTKQTRRSDPSRPSPPCGSVAPRRQPSHHRRPGHYHSATYCYSNLNRTSRGELPQPILRPPPAPHPPFPNRRQQTVGPAGIGLKYVRPKDVCEPRWLSVGNHDGVRRHLRAMTPAHYALLDTPLTHSVMTHLSPASNHYQTPHPRFPMTAP
jgi:hypothetical protein